MKDSIFEPTEIQVKAIPLALENKDLICQSFTGSGKTLAYLLPIFEKIDFTKREMQAIVLAPTHELAVQINNVIKLLAKNSEFPVTSSIVIGNVNIKRQIDNLKAKPHIIVGSSGRILELIKKKKIHAHTIKTIVLDEGDKLLDENNINTTKDVIKTTMRDRQLMIFSASIKKDTITLAKEIMKEAETIIIKNIIIPQNINHMYFRAERRDKIEVLRKLLNSTKPQKAIIFINKNDQIQILVEKLRYHKLKVNGIYGEASKMERKKAIDDFKKGNTQLLVASDLAARGLDIKGVTHIFNLDLPESYDEYIHRVGRTGRVETLGTAISIVTEKEIKHIKKIEKIYNIKISSKRIYEGNII